MKMLLKKPPRGDPDHQAECCMPRRHDVFHRHSRKTRTYTNKYLVHQVSLLSHIHIKCSCCRTTPSLDMAATTTATMNTHETHLPATMRAWQWTTCTTTLESALTLKPSSPLPSRPLSPGECLIRVHAASLNPVDYKLAELPIVGRVAIPKPATPGLDFSGVVAKIGPDSSLKVEQRVFGKLEPKQQYGTLGEYVIGSKAGTVPLPDGISFEEGATMGVCGLVTYQCLVKNVKKGDRVLINGGSGGTGTFAVQIAKALGCEVVTTCSSEFTYTEWELKPRLLTPHRRECTVVRGLGSR